MPNIFWVGLFPPEVPSIGDHAQILVIQQWFRQHFPRMEIIRFTRQIPKVDLKNWDKLLRSVKDDDLIFISSGCDFGNLYPSSHELRKKLISTFPDNKIIQLPVTVFYNHTIDVTSDTEFFANRKNVVLMCRDPRSYEILSRNLECNSLFVPDFAFLLKTPLPRGERKGALLILRNDGERKFKPKIMANQRQKLAHYTLKSLVKQGISKVTVKDVQIGEGPITDENRESIINHVLDYYQNFKVVVTDRLHGMVFSVLTHTPCIALEGKVPHKLSGYKKLLSRSVRFVDNIRDVPDAIRDVLSKPYQPTDLTPHFNGLKKRIFDLLNAEVQKPFKYRIKPSHLMELIKGRRSIRKWHNHTVEEQKIQQILTASIYAPTASNYQATRFHVVRDKKLIAQISSNSAPWFKHNHPDKIIAVLFDVEKPHPLGFNFKKPHAWSRFIWQDSAVAMQNMMLMAEALGLKTCWQSIQPRQLGDSEEKLRRLLNIPSRYVLACLLFLGYGERKNIARASHYGVPVKRNPQEAIISSFQKLRLKILHVWDQAGVAALIAKYQRRLGHEAVVVKRYGFDGLSIGKLYGTHTIPKRKYVALGSKVPSLLNPVKKVLRTILKQHRTLQFYITIRRLAKNYDILHIHSQYRTLFFTLSTRKIFEFHGDDARKTPSFQNPIDQLLTRLFLRVFHRLERFYVSTPDLTKDVPDSQWIPNPVDTELFVSVNPKKPNGHALYVHNWYETSEAAKKIAEAHDWKLTILDRAKHEFVRYEDMPFYLSQFEYFIDRHAIPSLSKTALEALALGLRVVNWKGEIVEGLPECHMPENVAKRTLKIYEELLND